MDAFKSLLLIVLSSALVNNFVLSRYLGCCLLGVSKKADTAVGMGLAVIFVMAMASVITWLVQYYLLEADWLPRWAYRICASCRPSRSYWSSPRWCSSSKW